MIKTDINGDIGIISIDRAPVNAINPDIVLALKDALDSFKSNDDINGVILKGRDGIFSAGHFEKDVCRESCVLLSKWEGQDCCMTFLRRPIGSRGCYPPWLAYWQIVDCHCAYFCSLSSCCSLSKSTHTAAT